MTNDNLFDGIDEVQVEEQADYIGYPRIHWYNGVKQAQTAGHFYTKEAQYDEPLGEPWKLIQRYEDGDGYAAETLRIVPIRRKSQCYFEKIDGKNKIYKWLPPNKYEDGARKYTEILCVMEGYDGLVILTAKGLTGKALTGMKDGLFTQMKNRVFTPAKKTLKKGQKLPSFSFWMPITCERDAKGRVVFTDTGRGSNVTRPVLDIPDAEADRDLLKSLYVGKEMLKDLEALFHESAEWAHQFRDASDLPTLPHQVQKNEMKPLEDSDSDIFE
jgi:hypothetical protein